MADFTVRSDSVDVEQIMQQIRARIREKRGVDYTEAELQQLATVKLQKFLDPRGVRSDLVEQFRRHHKPAEWPNYSFESHTIYDSHRGPIRLIRRLLRPILKLFFNPDTISAALNVQSKLNTELLQQQERESLRYELVHNLVVEMTRLGIEVQNLKMRVESVSSRLDFDERRARSLESVVQYRQPAPARSHEERDAAPAAEHEAAPDAAAGAETREGGTRKRRRRRRRRKPGATLGSSEGESRQTPESPPDETPADGATRTASDQAEASGEPPRPDAGSTPATEPAAAPPPAPSDTDRGPEGGPGDGAPDQ